MVSQAPTDTAKTPRWARVEELYHAALERGDDDRDTFLEAECAGDRALLREVRSLLDFAQPAERFIEGPVTDGGEDRLSGGPLSIEDTVEALREMARVWRQRTRKGAPS